MPDRTSQITDTLKPIEKINILLKEYDTLRAEAIARINSRFAFLGLLLGVVTFAATQTRAVASIVAILVAIVLLGTWFYLGQLLFQIRSGLQRIESEINKLAGEKLLSWQSNGSSRFLERAHGMLATEENSQPTTKLAE